MLETEKFIYDHTPEIFAILRPIALAWGGVEDQSDKTSVKKRYCLRDEWLEGWGLYLWIGAWTWPAEVAYDKDELPRGRSAAISIRVQPDYSYKVKFFNLTPATKSTFETLGVYQTVAELAEAIRAQQWHTLRFEDDTP